MIAKSFIFGLYGCILGDEYWTRLIDDAENPG